MRAKLIGFNHINKIKKRNVGTRKRKATVKPQNLRLKPFTTKHYKKKPRDRITQAFNFETKENKYKVLKKNTYPSRFITKNKQYKKRSWRYFNQHKKRKQSTFFRLFKKWRFWRFFKRYFLFKKRKHFFLKLKWKFNNLRIIWHQYCKIYTPKIKHLTFLKSKYGFKSNFVNFFKNIELRLNILITRAKFCYTINNSGLAIKHLLISINGIFLSKVHYLTQIYDLIQKRRYIRDSRLKWSYKKRRALRRRKQMSWRRGQWRHARYVIHRVRRVSHFSFYWSRRRNATCNYLEVNYKVPGCIPIRRPLLKEVLIQQNNKFVTKRILKRIYLVY